MFNIEYTNMPVGSSKFKFTLRYLFNIIRTWYLFHIKYTWVKYDGFVRVMPYTRFAKYDIKIGKMVQFGKYCSIASSVHLGNYILMASRVCFIGKNDHIFSVPKQYIWDGQREDDGICIVEDDVWIGHGSTIVGSVKIGKGSIIAAGSILTRNIPPCEIWGGVPAQKIRNRFSTEEEKLEHLNFL